MTFLLTLLVMYFFAICAIRIHTMRFIREKNLRRTLFRIAVELYALCESMSSSSSSKNCNNTGDRDNNFSCGATNLPFSAEPYTVLIINFDIPKRIMNNTNAAMLMNWFETQPVAHIFPLCRDTIPTFFFEKIHVHLLLIPSIKSGKWDGNIFVANSITSSKKKTKPNWKKLKQVHVFWPEKSERCLLKNVHELLIATVYFTNQNWKCVITLVSKCYKSFSVKHRPFSWHFAASQCTDASEAYLLPVCRCWALLAHVLQLVV